MLGSAADLAAANANGRLIVELVLDLALAVGEDEAGVLVPVAQLGRDAQRAVRRVRVVGLLPVRRVQVGADPRVVALHGRLLVRARPRDEDRVVGRRRVHLVAERVEQELPERVVADVVLGPRAIEHLVERLRLRLRAGRGSAVGLVRDERGGPLVVVLPVLGEVAVAVHAVEQRDPVVGVAGRRHRVVVAEGLPPQPVPLRVERVLVAVGVLDQDEPHLGRPEDVHDPRLLLTPSLDEPLEQPAVHLAGDPLAGVDRRGVQDRGLAAVGARLLVGGEAERHDVAGGVGAVALRVRPPRLADDLQVQDVLVRRFEVGHVLPEPVGPVVVHPHLEAGLLLLRGEGSRREPGVVPPDLQIDPTLLEPVSLERVDHEDHPEAARDILDARDVVALAGEELDGRGVHHRLVHLQLLARDLRGARGRRRDQRGEQDERHEGGKKRDPVLHRGTSLGCGSPEPMTGAAGCANPIEGRFEPRSSPTRVSEETSALGAPHAST